MTSLTTLANSTFQRPLGNCPRKQRFCIQPPNDVTDDPGKFDIQEPIGVLPAETTTFVQPSHDVTDEPGKLDVPKPIGGLLVEAKAFYTTAQWHH